MSGISGIPRSLSAAEPSRDRLDSWKEIAAYLKRDVRTVQRWEKSFGLPVRRLQHETQGTVFAYKSEIDNWWRNHQLTDIQKTTNFRRANGRPLWFRWALLIPIVVISSLAAIVFQVFRHRVVHAPAIIPRQLTANAIENRVLSAAISPDGTYLAYTDDTGISLRRVDSGGTRLLPSTRGLYVQNWFPDGNNLLAARYTEPSLWSVSVVDGAARKLQQDAGFGQVSPDGAHVASWRNVASELWIMGPSGEEPQKIWTAKASEILADITWSPNGRRLAYAKAHRTADADDIVIETCDLSGKDTNVIWSDRRLEVGGATGLAWLPDGRLIFSLANSGSTQLDNNLWAIDTDIRSGRSIGGPRQLTALSGFLLLNLTRSTDGKRLAFLKAREQFGIYVATLDRNAQHLSEPKRLTLDNWNNLPSGWTSDSEAVLFDSDRNGHLGTFRQRIDQSAAEPLVPGNENYHRPIADYNARSILVWQGQSEAGIQPSKHGSLHDTEHKPQRLMRIDVSGGPAIQVLTALGNASFNCASTRPNFCILAEQDEDRLTLSSFDPSHGRRDELLRLDINGPEVDWSLSPDGQRVALGDRKRIRIVDLKTRVTQDLVLKVEIKDLSSLAWSADGDGLFFAGFLDMKSSVLYSDLKGNARQLFEYAGWIGNLMPSPDGKRLAFAQTTQEINAAMIEDF